MIFQKSPEVVQFLYTRGKSGARERDVRTERTSVLRFLIRNNFISAHQSFTWRIRWAEPRSPDAWAGSLWTECFLEDSWFPSPRTRSWGPFPDPESDGKTDLIFLSHQNSSKSDEDFTLPVTFPTVGIYCSRRSPWYERCSWSEAWTPPEQTHEGQG